MKGYRHIRARLLVSLVIVSIGIVIVELAFGGWINPHNLNRLNLIKNQTYTFDISGLYETSSPIVTYSRDKYGLRGTYGDDPARIDLLTVGGSTTDQRNISDGSTWQDVMQQQFNSIGTPIVLANAGVDGQSTVGHIKNFDWWFPYVPHLKPKYILFFIGLNDFNINEDSKCFGDPRCPSKGSYDDVVVPNQNPLAAAVREKSALVHVARTMRGTYEAMFKYKNTHRRVDFTKEQWTSEPIQNSYEFMSSQLDAFEARLRILVNKTRQLGAQPIFVTQPSRNYRLTKNGVEGRAHFPDERRDINGVDYYNMMRRFNSVTETVCREEHVFFFDLADELHVEDNDFYDFYHMTPSGARKVGLYLFERLREIVNTVQAGASPRSNRML